MTNQVAAYSPLLTDLGGDGATFQMATQDQEGLIDMLGSEVLPRPGEVADRRD